MFPIQQNDVRSGPDNKHIRWWYLSLPEIQIESQEAYMQAEPHNSKLSIASTGDTSMCYNP